jgi:hypothetical protein
MTPPPDKALSIGQFAKVLGIGRDRARALINAGLVPGVYTIPTAGRYGEATRIPPWAIRQLLEKDWAMRVAPGKPRARRPKHGTNAEGSPTDHFPELRGG